MNKTEFTNHIARKYTKLLNLERHHNNTFKAMVREAEMNGLTEQDAIDAFKAILPNAEIESAKVENAETETKAENAETETTKPQIILVNGKTANETMFAEIESAIAENDKSTQLFFTDISTTKANKVLTEYSAWCKAHNVECYNKSFYSAKYINRTTHDNRVKSAKEYFNVVGEIESNAITGTKSTRRFTPKTVLKYYHALDNKPIEITYGNLSKLSDNELVTADWTWEPESDSGYEALRYVMNKRGL